MRDIKFRAWDKQTKRLFQVQALQFYGANNTVDACWTNGVDFDGESTLGEPELNNLNNLVLMQYTGKKDINDVEIYNGDIVHDDEVIYLVGFGVFTDDNDFQEPTQAQTGFYIVDIHTDETFPFYSMRYRVIGNVYENPELLED